MPARSAPPPLNATAPLGQTGPSSNPAFPSAPPQQQGFASGPPPAPQGYPSSPPFPQGQPQQGYGSSRPFQQAAPQAYTSQPPNAAYASQPPNAAYASQPPNAGGFGGPPPAANPMGSQPPSFGAYSSAPPGTPLDVQAMAHYDGGTQQMPPGAPGMSGMPQNIGFAAPVLVDVTPRGLVVETAGGYIDTIIPRNSKIPCERTRRFATGRDMQTTVRVRVGQGEGPQFGQNTFLGEVELSGLRPAPRGEVTVAVTFEVDADGTLRIRARDVQSGQEARATLQLIGVADESSVVMMINRFAQQPVVGTETPRGPTH
jgi:molecular chaperone DnaK